jgi:8-oxo-dGTP diphosphatase
MESQQHTIVVALITNEKNEVLLARRNEPELTHAHNKWEFIGGGINFGEDPETAIVREVKEEAGVDVEVVRLLPKILSHVWNLEKGDHQILLLHYECKIVGGTLSPGLDEEISELKYFSLDEIKNLDTLPLIYEGCLLLALP